MQAQQANGQEDGADQNVETVEARGHEEDRTIELRIGCGLTEEIVSVQDMVIFVGLNAGEDDAQQDRQQQAGLGGLPVAGLKCMVSPGHRRARQQQDDRVQQRQAPRAQQLDALGRPGRPGSGRVHPVADFRDRGARFGEKRHLEEHPEEGGEEHHFRSDEQDHAVAQADRNDRGVIALAAFLDHVRPPAEHGIKDTGKADKEDPLGAFGQAEQAAHPDHRTHEQDDGKEGRDQGPGARVYQMVIVLRFRVRVSHSRSLN